MIATCDTAKTAERFGELKAYMVENVLDGDEFLCSHYRPPRATRGSCHNIHTRTSSENAVYMPYPPSTFLRHELDVAIGLEEWEN